MDGQRTLGAGVKRSIAVDRLDRQHPPFDGNCPQCPAVRTDSRHGRRPRLRIGELFLSHPKQDRPHLAHLARNGPVRLYCRAVAENRIAMNDAKALADALTKDEKLTLTELADRSGVILSLQNRAVASLNETGQFLVNLLRSGVTREEELVARLTAEFDVDESTARRDVEHFLTELARLVMR